MNQNWLKIENISTSNTKTNMEHQLWQQEQVRGDLNTSLVDPHWVSFLDCITEAGWFW